MSGVTSSPVVTGRSVLAWLLASFLVVGAVNAVMVVLALQSFTGETEAKSYAAGLGFNQTLKDVAEQRRRGWDVAGDVKAAQSGQIAVRAVYHDQNGEPLDGLDVTAAFTRPTNAGSDFATSLVSQGGGLYTATATPPLPGQWRVRISARRGEQPPYLLDYIVVME